MKLNKLLGTMLFAIVALMACISPASASMSPEMSVIAYADGLAPLPTFAPSVTAVGEAAVPTSSDDRLRSSAEHGIYLDHLTPLTTFLISTPLGGAVLGDAITNADPSDSNDPDPDIRT